ERPSSTYDPPGQVKADPTPLVLLEDRFGAHRRMLSEHDRWGGIQPVLFLCQPHRMSLRRWFLAEEFGDLAVLEILHRFVKVRRPRQERIDRELRQSHFRLY